MNTNLNTQQSPNILITGATGKTGKRIVKTLEQKGLTVRHGSRTGTPAFDWNNELTWAPALKDIKSVYLSYFPDLAVPQAPSAIRNFCNIAKTEGVEHIVLLSGRGEPAAQTCEDIVKGSGVEWSIFRSSWFNQNFSEGAFAEMVETGIIALPVNNVLEPFIDVNDIADVAVAALTEAQHRHQVYEVTGPRLLSFSDIAKELSRALGREIRFVPISANAFQQGMRLKGVPDKTIDMLLFLFNEVLDGRNAFTCQGVKEAIGRPAKDFSDFATNLVKSDTYSRGKINA